MRIIDDDGHAVQGDGPGSVASFLEEPYRSARMHQIFLDIDQLHNEPVQFPLDSGAGSGILERGGPVGWSRFLDCVGIEASVLYPPLG